MVMGVNSCPRGHEFEYIYTASRQIGSCFAFICCKILLKFGKTEKTKKGPRMAYHKLFEHSN